MGCVVVECSKHGKQSFILLFVAELKERFAIKNRRCRFLIELFSGLSGNDKFCLLVHKAFQACINVK